MFLLARMLTMANKRTNEEQFMSVAMPPMLGG